MGRTALMLLAVMTVTLAGDYVLKRAGSHRAGLASGWFALGVLFYLLTAVGWFFLLRKALGGRQIAGLGLALASVLAMAQG